MEIKKVCVVGAGAMGSQIALNTAINGYDVYVTDSFEPTLEKASSWASDYLAKRVKKGKLTQEDADKAHERYHVVKTLQEAAENADLVIEAIIEDVDVKRQLFENLNKIVGKDTILATNSSYIPSSRFADIVDNPSRLCNLHYFNPALVMKLTEVVQGEHTSDDTITTLIDFSRKTGKEPIWVHKEIEGFIANRLLDAISFEAFRLAEQGIATPQDIDKASELGLGHPMGPFRTTDFAGIDISYLANKRTFEETGVKVPGYDLIEKMYKANMLGPKTKKGFYDYE